MKPGFLVLSIYASWISGILHVATEFCGGGSLENHLKNYRLGSDDLLDYENVNVTGYGVSCTSWAFQNFNDILTTSDLILGLMLLKQRTHSKNY